MKKPHTVIITAYGGEDREETLTRLEKCLYSLGYVLQGEELSKFDQWKRLIFTLRWGERKKNDS